jgi:hypothetical protein
LGLPGVDIPLLQSKVVPKTAILPRSFTFFALNFQECLVIDYFSVNELDIVDGKVGGQMKLGS